MSQPQAKIPWDAADYVKLKDHGTMYVCEYDVREEAQIGGENRAQKLLQTFLTSRGIRYNKELSSPNSGWNSCSRLSTYLTWGQISLKRVIQETKRAQDRYRAMSKEE